MTALIDALRQAPVQAVVEAASPADALHVIYPPGTVIGAGYALAPDLGKAAAAIVTDDCVWLVDLPNRETWNRRSPWDRLPELATAIERANAVPDLAAAFPHLLRRSTLAVQHWDRWGHGQLAARIFLALDPDTQQQVQVLLALAGDANERLACLLRLITGWPRRIDARPCLLHALRASLHATGQDEADAEWLIDHRHVDHLLTRYDHTDWKIGAQHIVDQILATRSLVPGDGIVHDQYGPGIIVDIEEVGSDACARVRFNTFETEQKVLLAWSALAITVPAGEDSCSRD